MHSEMSVSHSKEESSPYNSIISKSPLKFDWQSRWLKGDEYAFILQNVDAYSQTFGLRKYSAKMHPKNIYEEPENGMLYFVEGRGLGSDFGFPRVQSKKKYRWKKMNFTTNLPKKNPKVTYIVASTTHNSRIHENEQTVYRMHAVIPYERQNIRPENSYILCHILEIKKSFQVDEIKQYCKSEKNVNFYRLFAFLQNSLNQLT